MFTLCPGCSRQFRIRARQLAAAEGLVQCGFCGRKFNALDHLYDKPVAVDNEAPPAASEIIEEPEFFIPEQDAGADSPETPMDAVEGDIDGFSPGLQQDEPDPGQVSREEPEIEPPEQATPGESSAPDDTYPFPQELEVQSDNEAGPLSRFLWSSGALLLVLVAALQLAWFNRDSLITRYPELLPYLTRLCDELDCTLVRYRNIDEIKLVNRDVRVHPRYEDALLINATFTNTSQFTQRFPRILFRLFDTDGQVIAHRQILASEYLDNSIDQSRGMSPGRPVHVVFEVANTNTRAVSFEFDFL